MDIDLTLQPEKVQNIAGVAVTHINAYVAELRRLFLVEDLVDSLKFALLLWLLTYIGAIFNGMTVVILCKLHFRGLRGRIEGICIKSSTAIRANQVVILAFYLQVVQKIPTRRLDGRKSSLAPAVKVNKNYF